MEYGEGLLRGGVPVIKWLGERPVDLAKEKGYRDGGSILQIVKRVDNRAQSDTMLKKKLQAYEQNLSSVDD